MKKEKIQESKKELEEVAGAIKEESWKKVEGRIEGENKELKERLEKANKLAEERLNQMKYLQADFENYRKQLDKEKEQIIRMANENLIKDLIVILDDFEAAIKNSSDEKNKQGLNFLREKFFDLVAFYGLKEIEALGKKFNPEFHEVLYREPSEFDEDEVIEEIQKGYMLKSKLIRTSKVKVSKKEEPKDLKINSI